MGVSNLRNAMIVAALGVSTSACTTMTIPTGGACIEGSGVVAPLGLGGVHRQSYNSKCGQTMAANSMIQSQDAGVRAVGVLTLEGVDPTVRANGDRVRDALANAGTTQYTVRRNADGSATLSGAPVITVPKAAPDAAPAAAPTPSPM